MQTSLLFLQAHWPLVTLFILILLYVIYEESRDHSDAHASPSFCVSLMNHENAMVWDVRDDAAFQAGHIVGAEHVPADQVMKRFASQKPVEKKRPLILVCQRGVTTGKLLKQIDALKTEQEVVSMQGGMQQWIREELPMTKKGEKHG